MAEQSTAITVTTVGNLVAIETEEPPGIPQEGLLIKGEYRGLVHKELAKRMVYQIKVKVARAPDKKRVRAAMRAGYGMIDYRVPQVDNGRVGLVGNIESARPDDGEDAWLQGDEYTPDYVTFTFTHAASEQETASVITLLEWLQTTDLTLEARFSPFQGRLL
jgi:hypothetical protein